MFTFELEMIKKKKKKERVVKLSALFFLFYGFRSATRVSPLSLQTC